MELEAMNAGLAERVGQLEAALKAGWQIPATRRRLVDRTMVLELIDQIRVYVPEQVQAAQQVLRQREQVLATARGEAAAVLAEARRQARRRLSERSPDQST